MEHISYSKVVEFKKEECQSFFDGLFTERLMHYSYYGFFKKIYLKLILYIAMFEVPIIRLDHHTPWLLYFSIFIILLFFPPKKYKLYGIKKLATDKLEKTFQPLYDRKIAICFTDDVIIYGKYVYEYQRIRVYLESPGIIILQNLDFHLLPIPIESEEEYDAIIRIFNKVYKNDKYITNRILY